MFFKKSSEFFNSFLEVARRFPISFFAVLFFYCALVMGNHNIFDNEFIKKGVIFAPLAAIFGIFLQLLYENFNKKKILFYTAAVLILILYFFMFITKVDYVSITRVSVLFTMFTFLSFILLSSNLKKHGSSEYEIPYVVVRISSRLFSSMLYSFIFILGLSALFYIIKGLLIANISERYLEDMLMFPAVVFFSLFFMAGVPDIKKEKEISVFPSLLRFILKFLIIPLSFCYVAVLYIYFFKTILLFKLPNGIIANIVIWFSIFSFILFILSYQLSKTEKIAAFYVKTMPKLIIPALIYMFYALSIRVTSYGITESRYYIIAVGIFLLYTMICFSFFKLINWKIIFFIFSSMAFLTLFSPFNSFNISKWSQNSRFKLLLEKNNMLKNGKITPAPNISSSDRSEITQIYRYLSNKHPEYKIKYLPENFSNKEFEKVFGFKYQYYYDDNWKNIEYLSYSISNPSYSTKKEASAFFITYSYSTEEFELENEFYKLKISKPDFNEISKIEIFKKNSTIPISTLNIKDIALKIIEKNIKENISPSSNQLSQEKMSYSQISAADINITCIFNSIYATRDKKSSEIEINSFSSNIVIIIEKK